MVHAASTDLAVAEAGAGATIELRDGSCVTLRPMQPSDADGLVRFHGTLSTATTYMRFFSVHPRLTPEEIHRFTHVDHRDREALVALAGDEIVGVGRFDRLVDASTAEVAFVICDQWQGRGLGTELFRVLARRARELGVTQFVAETLCNNRPMLNLFRHSGYPAAVTYEEVAHVRIDLAAGDPALGAPGT